MNNTLFPITAKFLSRHHTLGLSQRYYDFQLHPKLADVIDAQDNLNDLYDLQEKIQQAESKAEARIPRPLSLADVGLGEYQTSQRFFQCKTLEDCLVVLEWDIERAAWLFDRACCLFELSLNPDLVQQVKDNFKGCDLELKYNLPTLDPSRM
mgnify:CR=1 FL=1